MACELTSVPDSAATATDEPIRRVAIVGAGMMGAAIAAANIRRGLAVLLADADRQALATAEERIAKELAGTEPGSPSQAEEQVHRWVTIATEDAQLGQCDLVLESIVETLAAKQSLYARLEPQLAAGAILASNTSTIPIGRLAGKLADPRRFLGLHFFHPVRRRPLVEVVRGPQTGDHAIAKAVAYVKRIDKTPVVVGDGPGFLVNRLFFPYLAEALELLRDGRTVADVEQAAAEFGMALGPLRLMDEIGLDTVLLGGRVLWEAFPERIEPSPILIEMYKAGRWGRKSEAGFFEYPAELAPAVPGREDTGTAKLIAGWVRPTSRPAAETIAMRLLLPMVLEATRILEEQCVPDAQTIDLAVVSGLGFPAARGGLLRWADGLGIRRILAALHELEPLGPRFRPTALLGEMAARDGSFYPRSA